MTFAQKILKHRKEKGLSQEELAEICSVSRQSVSKWEAGLNMPETEKIMLLAKLFGVSTDYLLKNDYEEKTVVNETFSFEKICNLLLPRRKSMESLYENAELYDAIYDKKRDEAVGRYWKKVLEKTENIKTVFDCSIGTGQMTFGLNSLNFKLAGSDISTDMLEKCRNNAKERGIDISLEQCDFRKLSEKITGKYDLVISTGNSIPHVNNEDAVAVIKEMAGLVNDNGYLYIDIRNWDKILRDHQRFYFYNPWHLSDERVNLVQVWDYNIDGTITFNLVYTFEKDEKITRNEVMSVYYFPVSRSFLTEAIEKLGFTIIKESAMGDESIPVEGCDWYYILAKKN